MSFKLKHKPKKTRQPNYGKVMNFRRGVDPELFDRLQRMAAKEGLSYAEALRQCVRYALDNMEER